MIEILIGGGLRVPEGAWVDYLEVQGRPGLQVQEGRVRWWEPISTRTRSSFFVVFLFCWGFFLFCFFCVLFWGFFCDGCNGSCCLIIIIKIHTKYTRYRVHHNTSHKNLPVRKNLDNFGHLD